MKVNNKNKIAVSKLIAIISDHVLVLLFLFLTNV